MPLTIQAPIWGDIAGAFDVGGAVWVAPDRAVDITADVLAALDGFANRPGNPTKMRADVEPCVVDFKVNISDVVLIIDAFRGLPFPLAPGQGSGGAACPLDPCSGSSAGD